ncbi:PEP-CTERM sorting domain-containing protein [Nitrosomonas sp. HPC101]|uniref:PEP-CTERM sorting domain-containing protein n=1 Tax=Nitrosomonas sp. HPC101 TaxID=1658667 RepID=UPI00136EC22A|nr:PEP-CTERM sorting domain-containing protein [Nitrosomonas sp. HPC101]MXS84392.1 PEP-CTERM sorting domain-containing protein [Nitrosomonas sp. HPC101]
MQKAFIAAALFAAIGTVHADPVTLTLTSTLGNGTTGTLPHNSSWSGNPWNQGKPIQGNVYAGEFKFKTDEGLDFYAFCADIFHALKSGTTYQMDALTAGSVAGISSWEIARIGYLFDNYGGHLNDSANGKELTAFQLTLWEILFENNGSQHTNPLAKGNFKVTGFGDADDLANTWIKNIYENAENGTESELYDLFFLTSSSTCISKYTSGTKKGQCQKWLQDSQNLISWASKPENPQDPAEIPNEVPEPMPLLLLIAGLLALGFTRKLRCC